MQAVIDTLKYTSHTIEEVCDALDYEYTQDLDEYIQEYLECCEQCGLWVPHEEIEDGVCDYCWDCYGTTDYD